METFHVITPCSRPHNLKAIKENILSIDKNRSVMWHVCFDSTATIESERARAKQILHEDWIRVYEAATFKVNPGKCQINLVLTHFYLHWFSGFTSVLDDDNLLPPDFFCYNYDKNESLIYFLPQFRSSQTEPDIPYPIVGMIDQAQMVIHSDLLHFYPLEGCGDGALAQEICKTNSYKVLDKPIVYYNKLGNG